MAGAAHASPLREILEPRLSQFFTEADALFAEARDQARREIADQLNQAVRRIRQSADLAELGVTIADAAGSFAGGVIFFTIRDAKATAEKVRGTGANALGIEIPLASAAALMSAVESHDPVIAVTSPGEVSAQLMHLLDHSADGRVSIFPIIVRGSVAALVYAWGTVHGSALELVTQVGSAAWSELTPPAPQPSPVVELLTIAPARKPAAAWEDLSGPEQAIHLRAQRFARVQTAEIRLRHSGLMEPARAHGNIYEALRQPIDAARGIFRHSFFTACPSMVDYLHLELVRTLANDDSELLGKDYPGPMV